MIGYRISRRELRKLIEAHDPDWLTKAANGEAPAWKRIKEVFIEIQHFKCGYCERPMPSPQGRPGDVDAEPWGGLREYDLEHFRPRGAVARWPTKVSRVLYDFETGGAADNGYPWLSHDFLNYLVSCKTCNSDNKRTYFPIAGRRGSHGDDVKLLNHSERPFLVYPVGAGDARPEELIGFCGFLAVPRGSRGHKRRRGTIIIDLLGLNLRDDLILQRCNMIRAMWPYLENRRIGNERERGDAAWEIGSLTDPRSQHANCARCFDALYESDRAAARICYKAARARLNEVHGSPC